jgi:hypothetical protein
LNYEFNFFNSHNFLDPFDFDHERELNITGRKVTYSDDAVKLIEEIHHKLLELKKNYFEPEFLLMNERNYEKLIAWLVHNGYNAPVDEFEGMKIIIWDVPCDFVNVRAKASTEWAYGESVRK